MYRSLKHAIYRFSKPIFFQVEMLLFKRIRSENTSHTTRRCTLHPEW